MRLLHKYWRSFVHKSLWWRKVSCIRTSEPGLAKTLYHLFMNDISYCNLSILSSEVLSDDQSQSQLPTPHPAHVCTSWFCDLEELKSRVTGIFLNNRKTEVFMSLMNLSDHQIYCPSFFFAVSHPLRNNLEKNWNCIYLVY